MELGHEVDFILELNYAAVYFVLCSMLYVERKRIQNRLVLFLMLVVWQFLPQTGRPV
jgi:hypothetical protein